MSCGVGRRHGLDPMFLWLWYRLAAVVLIQPLAWELPYAVGAAIKRWQKKKKEIFKYRIREIIRSYYSNPSKR